MYLRPDEDEEWALQAKQCSGVHRLHRRRETRHWHLLRRPRASVSGVPSGSQGFATGVGVRHAVAAVQQRRQQPRLLREARAVPASDGQLACPSFSANKRRRHWRVPLAGVPSKQRRLRHSSHSPAPSEMGQP